MDPKTAPLEVDVIAVVLNLDQVVQHRVAFDLLANVEGKDAVLVLVRITKTEDTGDRGHHDHVVTLQERGRGRVPQLIDLIVDGGILFNVGITGWYIGLRLVVIIVRNEIFHRIIREELLHFAIQLPRQGLVVGKDQGRFIHVSNHVGDREGLPGPRCPQEDLGLLPLLDSLGQLGDGLGLVSGWLIV